MPTRIREAERWMKPLDALTWTKDVESILAIALLTPDAP